LKSISSNWGNRIKIFDLRPVQLDCPAAPRRLAVSTTLKIYGMASAFHKSVVVGVA
jgi:hypothetical protein